MQTTTEAKPIEFQAQFIDEQGQPFDAPEKFHKEKQWFKGNIIVTGTRPQRRHHEIFGIDKDEEGGLATISVRPIKPQGYKGILLGVILIGCWFLIQHVAERLFS